MTQADIAFVKLCIENDIHDFYNWGKWKRVRQEVLEMDKHECRRCRDRKIYTRASTVHHNNHVKDHPELALEIYYECKGQKKRNLISLCHECHEAVHGYRKRKCERPLTEERW